MLSRNESKPSDSDDEILARIEEGFANRGQLRAGIDAALVKVDVRLDRYTDLVAEELSRL
ncbi:hypothetical protein [Cereibacter sphaeroides]|uniref:hypothetical protein n=1 Tax=Cereibacter sphaeroides TaxID=1063 RepID=UPI001F36F9F3|nr:hypothetical protein [Cereibacter sphaeroides]MCE6967577.1 hypothetical protein [Cereibacter sphaeroides]